MSAGVFVGVLGWVIAGLLAAFLAVLTVGMLAGSRRTTGRAGCRTCVCSWRGCCWCSARSSARRCLPVWGCGFDKLTNYCGNCGQGA